MIVLTFDMAWASEFIVESGLESPVGQAPRYQRQDLSKGELTS
jgi:hypothetical protein